jgi:hypothetical protein
MTGFQRIDRAKLQDDLDRSFVEGVDWPVPDAALAALVDMGLSDETIARYFGVSTSAVRREREERLP